MQLAVGRRFLASTRLFFVSAFAARRRRQSNQSRSQASAQGRARSFELKGAKMKSQRLIASLFLLLLIGIAPMAAHAVCVRLNSTNADGTLGFAYLPSDCLTAEVSSGTVFLDSNSPFVGAPATYGPFRIEKCPG